MSYSSPRPSDFVRRSLALAAILSASVAVASAQTTPASSEGATQAVPVANLHVPAVNTGDDSLFSSSSDSAVDVSAEPVLTADAVKLPALNAQYGGGRYGKPRYRGGNTNQDGSPKWAFLAGAGLTIPVTQDSNYLKTSWGFQVGGGRNFNKTLSLIAQFDYDNFGFTAGTIENQSQIYFGDTDANTGLDGNSHIWSLTLNPTINFYAHEGIGAYFVVGGGYYHKEASFFIPVPVTACDQFGFCYQYAANQTIQNYTSNSTGVNGGVGITFKPSRFSGERLYVEGRVVHTFNQYKPIATVNANGTVSSWNFFPQNSQETTYFPVKVGIRF